jgi:hypothetical protein
MKTYGAFVEKKDRLGSEFLWLNCASIKDFKEHWSKAGARITSKIIEKGKTDPKTLVSLSRFAPK